jgi:7tm Odorant receptor
MFNEKIPSATSQHHHDAFLRPLPYKIHLRGAECQQDLPNDGHLEPVEFPSFVRRIGCSVEIDRKHCERVDYVTFSPLFFRSLLRYHQISLQKMRKLFTLVIGTTFVASLLWTTITFFGDSTKLQRIPDTNDTMPVEIPRLLVKSWYPFNPVASSMRYFGVLAFQIYFVTFSMIHANSADSLFCSWVLFACEQLQHLKVKCQKTSNSKVSLNFSVNRASCDR